MAAGRPIGADLDFSDGLNVIRARNNAGKSTLLQSIIFALGLEGMLTSRHEVPLPPVMTSRAMVEESEADVIESYVEVEVGNSRGDVLTARRWAASQTIGSNLIRVWGRQNGRDAASDYFVRQAGGATRERGFHTLLADFIGWDLPLVTTFSGRSVPLYLECLFPLFYVEQKAGWAGVAPRMPTYLGIPEMARRAAEFVLGFQTFDRSAARDQLMRDREELRAQWRQTLSALDSAARTRGVLCHGPPQSPSVWQDAFGPVLQVPSEDTEDTELTVFLTGARRRLEELQVPPQPVGETRSDDEDALSRAEALLRTSLARGAAIGENMTHQEVQLRSIEGQITELRSDRSRLADLRTLRNLGSDLGLTAVSDDRCPTCEQPLEGIVLAEGQTALGIEEQIELIEHQRRAVEELRAHTETTLEDSSRRFAAVQSEVSDLRQQVRTLRENLQSPDATPSLAAVNERIELENKIHDLARLEEEAEVARQKFEDLGRTYTHLETELASLGSDDLDEGEELRVARFQASFVDQLSEYGFSSVPPQQVQIVQSTLRPTHEGFDLGAGLSASDMIRTKWAYLVALLEVSFPDENHLGLLVLDEPRQQETERASLRELLARLRFSLSRGAQVIFATSEEPAALTHLLEGVPHQMFEGGTEKLLQPVQQY